MLHLICFVYVVIVGILLPFIMASKLKSNSFDDLDYDVTIVLVYMSD